ncbi:phosphate acyltransferase [Aliiroseovarius sp. PrR006]|uniref:phosphate acyltransferase n=1 Tax=Aliiroseovarius sp. PrR006 TaxID=2706883 RepID=UPI0013D58346|nr:phosphate acyltransferase [Aliiroseovarius sp. PrR006]NDW54867.1 phosphate butyryltransferase [Aliiroseovarius sp. PrR006]
MRRFAGQGDGCTLCVAGGNEPDVIRAVVAALQRGLVTRAIITGDVNLIDDHLSPDVTAQVDIRNADTPAECAELAVAAIRSGEGDILMKGHVDSTSYLRAVVNRTAGLRGNGILSNVTVAEMSSYPKLIAATDNGIVPAPDLDQKRQILLNTAPLFRGLGIDPVKVAAVAATEKVSDALPATLDAQRLAQESRQGKLPGFVVDGPFGYDVAVSRAAAETKKLEGSAVAGEADLLLFPTIDAANAVAKSWKYHGAAETGSLVLGAVVPVLLNSRSDTVARRINALLLALAVKAGENQ